MRLALLIRQCGEQAERQFGSGARELIDDALTEFEREFEASYSDKTTGRPSPRLGPVNKM